MKLISYPKINVGLKVFPVDESGYHPINSLFLYSIGELKDEIQISLNDCNEINVFGYDIKKSDNLVYKAHLALLQNQVNLNKHSITIKKKIPTGAGLGGGSSNAGVYLKNFGSECSQLIDIARSLGADVPFFLQNKACFVSGHGEILEPVLEKLEIPALIITPKIHCDTAVIFKLFDELPNSRWEFEPHVILHHLKSADQRLQDILHNDLEAAACLAHPKLALIFSELRKALTGKSYYYGMSGSGSSFFALFKNVGTLKKSLHILRKLNYQVHESMLYTEI